jgi:hypothetical protein
MAARETQEQLPDSVSPAQMDASVATALAGVVLVDPSVDAAQAEAVAAIDVPVAGVPERSAALSFAARAAARLLAAEEQ